MYRGERVLGLIIARGGSKGLPDKNIRELAGKPVVAWSIAAAAGSELLDRVVLSTDSESIAAIAREHGCEVPFSRPAALAADDVTAAAVVCDALERLPGYDYVVLLQATSPARRAEDIDGAIRACVDSGARSCVSMCEPGKSPYWMYRLGEANRITALFPAESETTRRQDLPPAYVLNGAVYVVRTTEMIDGRRFIFDDTVAYLMPPERSIDIDSELDLVVAAHLLGAKEPGLG